MTKTRVWVGLIALALVIVVASYDWEPLMKEWAKGHVVTTGVDKTREENPPLVRFNVSHRRLPRGEGEPVPNMPKVLITWLAGPHRPPSPRISDFSGEWSETVDKPVPVGAPLAVVAKAPVPEVEMRCEIYVRGRRLVVMPGDGGFRMWPNGEFGCEGVMPPESWHN